MSNQDILSAQLSNFFFTTSYFRSPLDKTQPWIPYPNQIAIYNIMDYGYDFLSKVVKPPDPPKIFVVVGPRQSFGKSEGIASDASARGLRHDNEYILITNSDEKGAKLMLRRMKNFIRNSKFADQIRRDTSDTLYLENGTEIECFGQTENIRGRSATWCYIDEAALFDEAMITEVIMPTTRQKGAYRRFKTPDICMLSTPRETRGIFFEKYRMALENRRVGCRKCKTVFHRAEFDTGTKWDCRHLPKLSNCPKCGFNDYEYVDCGVALYHIDPYIHPSISRDIIDTELSLMGNTPKAQQEILGLFIAEASSVFREEWLINCTNASLHNIRDATKNAYTAMGVDYGKTHDNTVFTLGHINEKMKHVLDHIRVIPSRGGVEYEQIRKEFLDFIFHFNPYIIVPDSTGIGDAVVERMQYDINELKTNGIHGKYKLNGVDIEWELPAKRDLNCYIFHNKQKLNRQTGRLEHLGFVFDTNSKFELVQYLIEMFAQGMIQIPSKYSTHDVQMLWEELINFGYEYSNSGNIIYGVQSGHDDTVISFALMNWGLRERPQLSFTIPQLAGEDSYVLHEQTISRRYDI